MKYKLLGCFLLTSVFNYAETDKPNVILFLVDDMGLMDTSVPFDVNEQGEPIVHPLNKWYPLYGTIG